MDSKRCYGCGKTKSINKFHKNNHHKNGIAARCKECRCDADKKCFRKKTSKEYNRRRKLSYKYGITLEQHKQMYIKQNGCCAICNTPVEYFKTHTDHDHKTGEVRGLLCRRCNYGMAFIDDKEFVKNAKKYLKG